MGWMQISWRNVHANRGERAEGIIVHVHTWMRACILSFAWYHTYNRNTAGIFVKWKKDEGGGGFKHLPTKKKKAGLNRKRKMLKTGRERIMYSELVPTHTQADWQCSR